MAEIKKNTNKSTAKTNKSQTNKTKKVAAKKVDTKPTKKVEKKEVEKSSMNIWQISTFVLVILLIASLVTLMSNNNNLANQSTDLTAEEISNITSDFINTNLLQGQAQVEIKNVSDVGNMYLLKLSLNGQEIDSYVTKDGSLLFPQAIPLNATIPKPATNTQETAAPVNTKLVTSEKPVVELFVMSYCPYGTQIEKGILPVLDTLGNKIDFKLKFVNYAMHGQKEIDENLNQYCIQKNNKDKFNAYLTCFLEEGNGIGCIDSLGLDSAKIATCVKETDEKFGISKDYADKTTWKGQFPSFNIHNEENVKYSVRGSPTLVINGVQVQSARDANSLLKTVCSTFSKKPEECNTDLSSFGNPSPGFGFNQAAAGTAAAGCES